MLLLVSCSRHPTLEPPIQKRAALPLPPPPRKEVARPLPPPPRSPREWSIVLDPGHGGVDHGTKMIIPPYTREKTLALKTALRVEEFLKQHGYTPLLTRNSDVFIPLLKRVELAEKKPSQLFVSIHYNSTPGATTADGIEIYYYNRNKDERTKKSIELARCILRRMEPASQNEARGVRPGDFCVIRETSMPSVLIEVGFLSNPREAKRLRNANYIKFLGWSIAKGIEDFIEKNVPGAN